MALAASGWLGEGTDTNRIYLTGTLDAPNGTVLGYTATNGAQITTYSTQNQSVSGSIQNGDFMAIGLWDEADWTTPFAYSDWAGFVVGNPTPNVVLTGLNGVRARYDLVAATPVRSSSSADGTLLSSSHLVIDFLGAGQYVGVDLNVQMPGVRIIPINLNPLAANLEDTTPLSTNYRLRGSANGLQGGFTGFLTVDSDICSYGGQCGTGQFAGFIGGAQGQQAGVAFNANTGSNSPHREIVGAGRFTQTGNLVSTPSFQPASTDGNYQILGTYLGVNNQASLSQTYSQGANASSFAGSFLTGYSDYSYAFAHQASSAKSFAAVGNPADSDFIGWGYWAEASRTSSNSYNSSTQMVNHLHYLVGKPASNTEMPISGTANYSFLGGTNPTATLGSVTQVGQILPSSNLSVDFSNSAVTANINTRFGNTSASFSTTDSYISGSRIESCGNSSTVSGFFTGPGAIRAGIVYQNQHNTLGTIRGAASFQRSSGTGIGFGRND